MREGTRRQAEVNNVPQKQTKAWGWRTVRSTGRCGRAGTPCTGSRRSRGSRRSGRTCDEDKSVSRRPRGERNGCWGAELTGCLGRCGGRRRAGSPPGCRRSGRRRSRAHTARTAHPGCCAGSSDGTNKSFYSPHPFIGRACGLSSGPSYRADARFRVAGVRVAVALAQLAVSQVQSSACARVARCTILEEKSS